MVQQYQFPKERSQKYDTVNSLVCLWVSYKDGWNHPITREYRHNQTYYMRFAAEKDYQGATTEMPRVWSMVDYIYRSGMRYKTMVLYRNSNNGGTHPNKSIINQELFKVTEQRGELQFFLNNNLPGDTNGALREYINDLFEHIREMDKQIKYGSI